MGIRPTRPNEPPIDDNGNPLHVRMFPTKTIRTISLAPSLESETEEHGTQSDVRQMMEDAAGRMARPASASEVLMLSGVDVLGRW